MTSRRHLTLDTLYLLVFQVHITRTIYDLGHFGLRRREGHDIIK